jgi:precorrin-6A/cobalt-precorrin-6A reductase
MPPLYSAPSILILGGTTDARLLAKALAEQGGRRVELSLAGRTKAPLAMPVPTRVGGFGGAAGLADYLRVGGFSLLVDATHPFAARISANAVQAARLAEVPLISLHRSGWVPQPGDDWHMVADVPAAVAALGPAAARVFVTLGRQEVAPLLAAPQHHYLIRSVDPIDPPLPLPHLECLLDRGPFSLEGELALLRQHRISHILSKNSGGDAARAKLDAARALGIPVIMVARPDKPAGMLVENVAGVLGLLHQTGPAMARGV